MEKRQKILACLSPLVSTMAIGYAQGYSSVAISKMLNDSELATNQISWIGSLLVLGLIFGSLPGGTLTHLLSLRCCYLLSAAIINAGWFCIGFCGSVKNERILFVYLGRFLTGLGTGAQIPLNYMYISQICSAKNRGILLSLLPLFISIGIVVAIGMGVVLSWETAALIGGMMWPSLLGITCFWQAGGSKDEGDGKINGENTKKANSPTPSAPVMQTSGLLKPMLLLVTLSFMQNFSGANAITYYGAFLFDRMHLSPHTSQLGAVLIGVSFVVGYALVSGVLLERFGRKVLFAGSGALMIVSLGVVAAVDYAEERTPALSALSVSGVFGFCLAYSVGVGPIPYIYIGELLPAEYKGVTTGIVTTVMFSMVFLSVEAFPFMLEYWKISGSFLASSIICLFGIVYVAIFFPETKGLSAEEISAVFQSKGPATVQGEQQNRTNVCAKDKSKISSSVEA